MDIKICLSRLIPQTPINVLNYLNGLNGKIKHQWTKRVRDGSGILLQTSKVFTLRFAKDTADSPTAARNPKSQCILQPPARQYNYLIG